MITITPQQARERFLALPSPLQEAVFSVETSDIINSIGEKFNFEDEAISDVAEVVGLALLGFIHPDTIKQEITERVDTSEESLAGVTIQVQDRILNRFRGLLVNAFYSEPGKSTAQAVEAPMPLGEIPSATSSVPKTPIADETPKSVNFIAPSVVSDIRPAAEEPSSTSPWETPLITPESSTAPLYMENIQSSQESVGASTSAPQQAREITDVQQSAPVPDAAPAPFIMREESTGEASVGDVNISSAFGVDSSDQFKKSGPSETPGKPQIAQVEFGNFTAAPTVDYSSFAGDGEAPPPPPGNWQ